MRLINVANAIAPVAESRREELEPDAGCGDAAAGGMRVGAAGRTGGATLVGTIIGS
jgi:hypothetical protein